MTTTNLPISIDDTSVSSLSSNTTSPHSTADILPPPIDKEALRALLQQYILCARDNQRLSLELRQNRADKLKLTREIADIMKQQGKDTLRHGNDEVHFHEENRHQCLSKQFLLQVLEEHLGTKDLANELVNMIYLRRTKKIIQKLDLKS